MMETATLKRAIKRSNLAYTPSLRALCCPRIAPPSRHTSQKGPPFRDTPSLRLVVDLGVWFSWWIFWLIFLWTFFYRLPWKKQAEKNTHTHTHTPQQFHDFRGNFLTKIHLGRKSKFGPHKGDKHQSVIFSGFLRHGRFLGKGENLQ